MEWLTNISSGLLCSCVPRGCYWKHTSHLCCDSLLKNAHGKNVDVLLEPWVSPHLSQVTNTYILHLAMADECFLVGIPFLIVTMFMREWPFGTTMCKIYFTTTSINQITSSLFLMVLSADRYIAVCHPISSPRFRTGTISKVSPLRNLWLLTQFLFRLCLALCGFYLLCSCFQSSSMLPQLAGLIDTIGFKN